MFIGWTTVGSRDEAELLAQNIIESQRASCVQIDGPIISVYRWQGKVERIGEFRLTLKFLPKQARPLADWIHSHHPYATPEWIVVKAVEVGEKYLSWAKANSTNPPL